MRLTLSLPIIYSCPNIGTTCVCIVSSLRNENAGNDDEGQSRCLGDLVMDRWLDRKTLLDTNYAMAGWMLCVQPDVMDDVVVRTATGKEHEAMELVIEKLHYPPCPNKSIEMRGKTMSHIKDCFWNEYRCFTERLYPFNRPGRFLTDDAIQGRSYAWHKKYSLPYTEVLGYVACRVCSKPLGIGMAERAWGDLKSIKHGKRARLGGESTEMRSIIYTSANLTQKKAQQVENDRIGRNANNMFGEDDMK